MVWFSGQPLRTGQIKFSLKFQAGHGSPGEGQVPKSAEARRGCAGQDKLGILRMRASKGLHCCFGCSSVSPVVWGEDGEGVGKERIAILGTFSKAFTEL